MALWVVLEVVENEIGPRPLAGKGAREGSIKYASDCATHLHCVMCFFALVVHCVCPTGTSIIIHS